MKIKKTLKQLRKLENIHMYCNLQIYSDLCWNIYSKSDVLIPGKGGFSDEKASKVIKEYIEDFYLHS